jgi:transposase-like protein
MHSADLKQRAILMAKTQGIKKASQKIGAPIKSVKRWMKVGPYRKNAATPQM